MVECLVNIFIGRYTGKTYIGSLRASARHHLWSGQLAFDLITSVPVVWIEYTQRLLYCRVDLNSDSSDVSILRLVKLIKPLRLLRLLRMLKVFDAKGLKASDVC
jgi:hypothetical protein